MPSSTSPAERNADSIDLEQYYSEAGPDYAAWSENFNMHFGFYRWGMNPLRREAMLERMNREVLEHLRIAPESEARLLDMGCGLGATLRSFARLLPLADLTGITLVPWQVEQGTRLNRGVADGDRLRIVLGDYQESPLPADSFDAVYALESSCHAKSADKGPFLREAHRLLRPGGRLVVADGFLKQATALNALQRPIYRKLCECWVIDTLAALDLFTAELKRCGFRDIVTERIQFRVAPSIFHIPWVTAKFLLTDVVFGKRKMTRARWNNVLAPSLLPFVGWPVGPMMYCMISATKG